MAKNKRDGYHFNSKYWQEYKKKIPPIRGNLLECVVGMCLGDASVYHVGREAFIKFEQGAKQKQFLDHLFDLFKNFCFMEQPGKRYELKGQGAGQIKSYWFKTFSHRGFTFLRRSLYPGGRKSIQEEFLWQQLTPRGLAYWVMCDGSLHREGKTLIIHSQSFSWQENVSIKNVLKGKFSLDCRVVPHKTKYYVVEISGESAATLAALLSPYLIPSVWYKLPRV